MKTSSNWIGQPMKVTRAIVFAASDWSEAAIGHLWGAPQIQYRWFDNFVVSTQPIGCTAAGGTSPTPAVVPNPPTNVTVQ